MPSKERPGKQGIYVELDPQTIERVWDLAERNGRAFKVEVRHALERHLAQPPIVQITTPPLEEVEIEVVLPKKRRGRPRKAK